MGSYWHVENSSNTTAFQAAYPTLAAAFEAPGTRVNGAPGSACQVFLQDLHGTRYFIKQYHRIGWSLRDVIAAPKVRTEWRNLLFFRSLNISTPVPVAIGEERRWGVFRRGVLVTEEVVGAVDMARFAADHGSILHERAWFADLCNKLARPLRRLHDRGFAHNDLNWRNVLLTLEPELHVYFFDCPSGRRWIWPFRRFRIVKDLVHLDKMGRQYLTRTQRLRFFLTYAGHQRLDASDKRLLAQLLGRRVAEKYQQRAAVVQGGKGQPPGAG